MRTTSHINTSIWPCRVQIDYCHQLTSRPLRTDLHELGEVKGKQGGDAAKVVLCDFSHINEWGSLLCALKLVRKYMFTKCAVLINAAMNIYAQLSILAFSFNSFWHIARSGTSRWYGNSVLKFFRNYSIISIAAIPFYILISNTQGFSSSPTPVIFCSSSFFF